MTRPGPGGFSAGRPGFGAGRAGGAGFGVPGGFTAPARRPGRRPAPQPGGGAGRGRIGTGIACAVGYLVLIWAVHMVNVLVFGGTLVALGIHPLDPASLWHLVTAPVLHVNFSHLVSNSLPGAVFAFLVGLSGRRAFWEVTAFVVAVGGIGTWFFGGVGTNHVGASMLVYGWLVYLLVRGVFNRSLKQIVLGVVLFIGYSGLLWGVLPGTPGVSWQAHFFGAAGGVLAGMLITSDDPPKRR